MLPFDLSEVRANKPFEVLTEQGWKLGKILHVSVLSSGNKQLKISIADLNCEDVKWVILPSSEVRMKEET
jgi:hypothetical protein